MNQIDAGRLKEQAIVLARLHEAGLKPNVLKAKFLVKAPLQSHHHTCNHGGGHGKAARRTGFSNSHFSVKAARVFEKTGK